MQASLVEGCKLPVRMHGTEEWPLAEIISIKEELGLTGYYVHYVDCELADQSLCDKFTSIFFSQQTSR